MASVSSHTAKEVLVDLLAVVLGDKPRTMWISLRRMDTRNKVNCNCSNEARTLSRVPGANRGIALTILKVGVLK